MEKKMTFKNADDMKQALHDSGKVALYGLYFDTDKDAVKAESEPTLAEIAKLMKSDTSLRLHVVGHTDNQGKPDYNLDLSRRRAASVVAQLTGTFGIAQIVWTHSAAVSMPRSHPMKRKPVAPRTAEWSSCAGSPLQ
jgi:OmpA-OmpF porin, OOP family